MAVKLLSGYEVSDLCLGKPALRSLRLTDTVADALSALKRTAGDNHLSVWNCHHSLTTTTTNKLESDERDQNRKKKEEEDCKCIGKVCMVDIICFLCKPENLASPAAALRSPVSDLLPEHSAALLRHLQPNASLLEGIDAMYEGVHNLVIPMHSRSWRKEVVESMECSRTIHNDKRTFCWLTQEDVIRFLSNSIGVFSPTPASPINTLNVIDTNNIFAVSYDDPASSALDLLTAALLHQSSVAIVDAQGKLVGEISPSMLNSCDEAVAPAVATLSAGDLMAYIDCGSPPDDMVQLIKERLEERNLGAAVELLLGGDETGVVLPSWPSFSSSTSSSDEDFCSSGGKSSWKCSPARVGRRTEATVTVCYPWSSLVAVMIQALAHRVSYVWVVEEDGTLMGIVTFENMLKIFREQLKSMS